MKNVKYSIRNLIKILKTNNFKEKNFRKSNLMRLVSLKKQIKQGKLTNNLKILNDQRYYS